MMLESWEFAMIWLSWDMYDLITLYFIAINGSINS